MDKFIFEMRDVFSKDFCNTLIDKFEKDPNKREGAIFMGKKSTVIKELKSSTEISITNNKDWIEIDSEIEKIMNGIIPKYFDFLHENFDFGLKLHPLQPFLNQNRIWDGGYEIHRIDKGGIYQWHQDGFVHETPRFANILVYLNDLKLGQGGETEFINGRKITPEAGKVLMFPSTYTFIHRGCEVKDISKYTLNSGIFIA